MVLNKTKPLPLLLFMLLAILTAALSGCGTTEKEQQAQELLEKKYGEQFSVSVDKFQELGSGYYTAKAYSIQYPDIPFSVSVDNDGKNFSDNYVARRVCSRIREQVYNNIHATKGKLLVHVEAMAHGHGLDDPDMTISDFVNMNPSNRFSVYIFSSSAEPSAESIRNLLSGLECLPGGTLYIYSTSDHTVSKMQKYCAETDTPISEHVEIKDDCVYAEFPFAYGEFFGRCQ